jgi:hypothetical protein
MFTMLVFCFQHPGITAAACLASSLAFGILVGKVIKADGSTS